MYIKRDYSQKSDTTAKAWAIAGVVIAALAVLALWYIDRTQSINTCLQEYPAYICYI